MKHISEGCTILFIVLFTSLNSLITVPGIRTCNLIVPERHIPRGEAPGLPLVYTMCHIQLLPDAHPRAGLQPVPRDRRLRHAASHHHSLLLAHTL